MKKTLGGIMEMKTKCFFGVKYLIILFLTFSAGFALLGGCATNRTPVAVSGPANISLVRELINQGI